MISFSVFAYGLPRNAEQENGGTLLTIINKHLSMKRQRSMSRKPIEII